MENVQKGYKTTKIGRVVSDKMDKSRVILVERRIKHPIYKKFIRKSSKFMAHDKTNDTRIGDVVKIEEIRPMSKNKKWRIIEVLERAV